MPLRPCSKQHALSLWHRSKQRWTFRKSSSDHVPSSGLPWRHGKRGWVPSLNCCRRTWLAWVGTGKWDCVELLASEVRHCFSSGWLLFRSSLSPYSGWLMEHDLTRGPCDMSKAIWVCSCFALPAQPRAAAGLWFVTGRLGLALCQGERDAPFSACWDLPLITSTCWSGVRLKGA